jgi:hypothetical protein
MKYLLACLLIFCGVSSVDAATRFYLVPVVVNGAGDRTPKYFSDGTVTAKNQSASYFGRENWVLVASDLSDADDAVLVAKPDAFGAPHELDTTLTAGQVTFVQTRLEAANMPAQWVSTSTTWRQLLRMLIGINLITQRYSGRNATNFFSVTTLNATVGDLPTQVRADMLAAATDFGLSTTGITLTTTIRQALRILGEQIRDSSRMFVFNGVTL